MRPLVLCIGILFTHLVPAQASDLGFSSIFEQANHAYLDGDYATALKGFQKLIEAGLDNPDVYYNLANTYYRSGKVGMAILYFEKTLVLDPANTAALSNLKIARKQLIDKVVMVEGGGVGEPLWHGFIRGLDLGWLTWLFLVFYFVVFGILIVRRISLKGRLRRLLFWINVPALSILVVLALLFFSRIYLEERVHHGVVISKTVALREGPERSAKVFLEVHDGLKVRVLNQVGDFVRVRLSNGVEGFVASSQLGRI